MSKKLLIFITYITLHVAFTNGDCNLGKTLVNKFDKNKLGGTWYLNVIDSKETDNKYTCAEHHFNVAASTLLVTGTLRRDDSPVKDQAVLQDFSNNPFGITFSGMLKQYTGKLLVTATDYTGFSIIKGCFPNNNVKSFSWISYRTKNPTPENLSAAKKAVKELGMKWEDFYNFCIPENK